MLQCVGTAINQVLPYKKPPYANKSSVFQSFPKSLQIVPKSLLLYTMPSETNCTPLNALPGYKPLLNYIALFEYDEQQGAKLKFRCGNKQAECPPNLEIFIQTERWKPVKSYQIPQFYTNILTNDKNSKQFLCALIFYEPGGGDDPQNPNSSLNSSQNSSNLDPSLFYPKAITLISHQAYLPAFRQILQIIFSSAVFDNKSTEEVYRKIAECLNFYRLVF